MSSGPSTYAETAPPRESHASERASLALQRTIEALSRLGRAVDFIPEVLRIVAEAFGAKSCSFFEHSNDTIWLRYWWHQGKVLGPTELPRVDPEHLGAVVRMAQGFTVPRSHLGVDAFTRAEPSLVEHRRLAGAAELQRFAISMGWDRELNVPLHVAGIACGALVIYRGEDRPFDAEDVALGSALAKQLALALQVSRLVVDERERAAEVERRIGEEKRLAVLVKVHDALTRSLDSLASAPDIDEFLGEVLRIAAGQAGVELAHLWVHDADGWVSLHRGYCQGVIFDREGSAAMPLAHTYERPFEVPSAMIHGEPIFERTRDLVQDVLADEYAAQLAGPTLDVYRELGVQWELNVPLRFGGRCVAHLAVYLPTGREVTPDLVEMVHALGRQVTLAMELARLSAHARNSAISRERDAAALERAAQHARATDALSESVAALRSADDFHGIVPAVLGIVARAFGASACAVFETQGETVYLRHWYMGGVVYSPAELLALDASKWNLIHVLAGGFTVPPTYLDGMSTAQRSRTTLIDHRAGTLRPDFDAFCCERDWDLEINTPILVDGKAVGALVINRGLGRHYTAAEVALAETLTTQLALAMEAGRVSKVAGERAAKIARLEEAEAALVRDLAQEEKARAALQEMVDVVSSLPTLDAFVPAALRIVARTFGVGDCSYFDVLPDEPIRLRFWDREGRSLRGEELATVMRHRQEVIAVLQAGFDVPDSYFGVNNRERTRAFTLDHQRGTSVPEFDAWAVENGFGSELNVPLVASGQMIGALVIYRPAGATFEPGEIALAERLGKQLALAVATARLAEGAREAALAKERETMALERAVVLAKANEALNRSLATLAKAPIDQAPALLLLEVARAADAVNCYWLQFDPEARTLEVTIRVSDGQVLAGAPHDDPELFHAPFAADVTPAFAHLSATDAFVESSTHGDSGLIWPGVKEWHRRQGCTEAAAFMARVGEHRLGIISLAFRDRISLDDTQEQLVRSLTNQFALAEQLHRLSKTAERSAVARTRDQESEAAAARRSTLLGAVADFARALARCPSLEEGLAEAVRILGKVTGVDRVHVFRNERRDDGEVSFLAAAWRRPGIPAFAPMGTGLAHADFPEVIGPTSRGEAYQSPLHDKTGANRDVNAAAGPMTDLHVPVFVGERFWGILNLDDCTTERSWSDGEVDVLRGAAENLAVAIKRHELEEARLDAFAQQLAQEERASAALQEMVDVVSSLPTFDELIPVALGVVSRTFGVEDCAFLEAFPDEHVELRFWYRRGRVLRPEELTDALPHRPKMGRLLGTGFSVPDSYFGVPNIARTRASFLDHQRGTSIPKFDAWALENGLGSELSVPLVANGSVNGSLVIYRPAGVTFEPSEVMLGERLGRQLALAVATARLAEEAREAAVAREREGAAIARADELAAANAALRQTAARLAEAADLDEGLKEAIRNAANAVDGVGGALGVYIPEERGFRNRFQILDGEVQHAHADRLYSLDEPEMARAWEAFHSPDCVLWCPPDSHYLTADTRDYVRAHGFSAAVLTPILRGKSCIGYLGFFSRAGEAPKQPKRELVRSLADQIALMLEMRRLAEEAREAAVEKARLAAAKMQLTALRAANDALRRGTERVGQDGGLEALLGAFLLEAMQVTGASGAGITEWKDKRWSRMLAIAEHGEVIPPERWREEPWVLEAPGILGGDAGGFATSLHSEPISRTTLEEVRSFWPTIAEYHAKRGHVEVWNVPCVLRGRLLAHVGLAFREPREMDAMIVNTLTSLAQQMTLAIELTYLGDESKQAAVARERETAALGRATELQRANSALRRAIEGLTRLDDVRAFLDALLQASMEVAGAHSGTFAVLMPEGVNQIVLRDPNGAVPREQSIAEGTAILPWTPSIEALCQKIVHEELLDWSVPPDDEPNPDSMLAFHARNGSRAIRCVPMVVGAKLIGWLALGFADLDPDTAKEVSLLRVLADQATTAVEMARLADVAQHAAIIEERNRMAGEIHDSLAQSFTSIALQSESLLSGLDPRSPLRGTLGIIEKTARRGLAEARTSVLVLQPVKEAFGELELALKELAERSNIPGSIACEFRTHTEPCALSADVRSAVLRVAQEAVSNALRHSGARKIVVNFDVHDGEATLTVTDDGFGLREPERRGGLGIPGMRARAESLGGALTVFAGTESHGTTVRMRVDCHATQATHP